jgi:uncharacterized protein YdeI (YjbR/CyaY-like superfamily)
MNPDIDSYLANGCGRCDKYATPLCKVHSWSAELALLREILLGCDLQEELKWSHPCYVNSGKNILIMGAFKDYVALTLFKGALLKDPKRLLVRQTENVQSGRQLRFTKTSEIKKAKATIETYVAEAIALAQAGLKVEKKKTEDFEVPDELKAAFRKDANFRRAFQALTPGRQRGYLLHFSGAKQSQTRASRIDKSKPKIFKGLGLHDR